MKLKPRDINTFFLLFDFTIEIIIFLRSHYAYLMKVLVLLRALRDFTGIKVHSHNKCLVLREGPPRDGNLTSFPSVYLILRI